MGLAFFKQFGMVFDHPQLFYHTRQVTLELLVGVTDPSA
jgi:hypothetical protein